MERGTGARHHAGRGLGRDVRRDLPDDVRANLASATRRPRPRRPRRSPAWSRPPRSSTPLPDSADTLSSAKLGFHVTGVDRSESSSRRRDGSRARSSGRSGYRRTSASCRSRTRVSTLCSASSRRSATGARRAIVQAFAQFLRVLRPGAPLVDRDPPPRPADDLPAARLGAAPGRRRPARGARLRLRRRRGRHESHLPLGRRAAERHLPRALLRRPS